MATKLLLLEDVDSLGRKGEVVSVKPGYARNFLVPQNFAVQADKHTMRLQERLKSERLKRAAVDKGESEEVAAKIEGITLSAIVKVDHDGHMYGSVSANDIVQLLAEQAQVEIDKKSIQINPIKKTGTHVVQLKLKEQVTASFNLRVMSEEESLKPQEESAASEE